MRRIRNIVQEVAAYLPAVCSLIADTRSANSIKLQIAVACAKIRSELSDKSNDA